MTTSNTGLLACCGTVSRTVLNQMVLFESRISGAIYGVSIFLEILPALRTGSGTVLLGVLLQQLRKPPRLIPQSDLSLRGFSSLKLEESAGVNTNDFLERVLCVLHL